MSARAAIALDQDRPANQSVPVPFKTRRNVGVQLEVQQTSTNVKVKVLLCTHLCVHDRLLPKAPLARDNRKSHRPGRADLHVLLVQSGRTEYQDGRHGLQRIGTIASRRVILIVL